MDQTLEAALDAARRAVNFDKNEQNKQAIYYYSIAVKLLQNLSTTIPALIEKCNEYHDRIIQLQKTSKFYKSILFLKFYKNKMFKVIYK